MAKGEKNDIIGRVIDILSCLNKGPRTTKELSKLTTVSERTIQRDMLSLEKVLLVEKVDNKWAISDNKSLAGKVASAVEKRFLAAYIDALKNIPMLSSTVNQFQNHLTYNFDVFKVITERPMNMSDDEYIIISELCNHIKNRNKIKLKYSKDKTIKILSPYRIMYHDGFWYLAAVTENSGNLIKLRLDFIESIKPASYKDFEDGNVLFTEDPAISQYIDNATSAWFNAIDIPVTLRIFGEIVDTFEKRQVFNNQTLEYKNGECYISFTVANFQDFFASAARYMPLFEIISPVEFKAELKEKIAKYI